MEFEYFFTQQKVIYDQRLKEHKLHLSKSFKEVQSLLGNDEGQTANFETLLYITFLWHNPQKLKSLQKELRTAKKLKEKISKKAAELSSLLRQFHNLELFIEDAEPTICTLSLIQEAGKRIYAKNGAREHHTEEAQDYKDKVTPVIKGLSKNMDTHYSCPNVDELLFELHKNMDAIDFEEPETRQPSARATTVKLYGHLIDAAKNKTLRKAILDISPSAIADLINIILDLDGEVSGETARKAFEKARQQNCQRNQDNCD